MRAANEDKLSEFVVFTDNPHARLGKHRQGGSYRKGRAHARRRRQDRTNGLSVILFESEDAARAASEMARQAVPTDLVTLDNIEIREVVASA